MKIALDLQSCQTDSRDRGIGRYALSFGTAWAANPNDNIVAMLDAGDIASLRGARLRMREQGMVCQTLTFQHPRSTPDQGGSLDGRISNCAALLKAKLIRAVDPDAFICTSFFEGFDGGRGTDTRVDRHSINGVPTAVVAYDLIPLIFGDIYLKPNPKYRSWYEKKLEEFQQFDFFYAISEATRKDLISYLGIEQGRIFVIGAGIDNIFLNSRAEDKREFDDRTLASLGIREPFILTVGNADWRKNNLGALDAFSLLPGPLRARCKLVLTQAGDDVRQALAGKHHAIADRVLVVGKVSDRQLSALYRKCEVMLFPSLYEGFGLPIVEAMAHGAPVVSSSRGSLAEIALDDKYLYDPDKPMDAADLLERLLVDGECREMLSQRGLCHAEKFTWERCAGLAREALDQVRSDQRSCGGVAISDEEVLTFADAVEVSGVDGMEQLRGALSRVANGDRWRLLIDVTETSATGARTGIQRVVRNYCAELIEFASASDTLEVVPIQCGANGTRYAWSFVRDVLGYDIGHDDSEVEVQPNDVLFLLDSTWENPARFDDLVHAVWRQGGEVIRMVYDLVPIRVPHTCHPGMPPVFHAWLRHAVNLADGLVCISESVRADLESFMDDELAPGISRPWTRAVHLGCDLDAKRNGIDAEHAQGRAVLEALGARPFLIAVGTIEPRKDHATIVKAVEQVWAGGADIGLVLVGKQGWNVDGLASHMRGHPELGRRLFWLEEAGDGDLQLLLQKAAALVQASLSEGFGLPIVEAGSRGVPLILSDLPVFREVAGDEAAYFRVGDPTDLAAVVRRGFATGGWPHPRSIRALTWAQSAQELCGVLLFNAPPSQFAAT